MSGAYQRQKAEEKAKKQRELESSPTRANQRRPSQQAAEEDTRAWKDLSTKDKIKRVLGYKYVVRVKDFITGVFKDVAMDKYIWIRKVAMLGFSAPYSCAGSS